MWALKKILVPTRTFRPDGMGLNFRNDYDLSALTEHELEEMRLSEKQTEQVVIGQEHSWYVPPRIEGRNNLLLDPAKIKELAEEQFWNPDAVGGYIEDRVEAYTGGEGYVREAFLHTGEAFSILVKKTLFTHMPREHQKAVENACIAYSEDPQPLLERLILDTHSNAVEDIMRAIRNVMILNSKDEVNWQAVRTYCMGE